MTTQTKHTPEIIYRVINKEEWEKLHQDGAHYFASVADEKRNIIAQCSNMGSLKTAQANAQFIVTACNSFYELLEACKTALEVLHISEVYATMKRQCGLDGVNIIKQAIAKAEGKG